MRGKTFLICAIVFWLGNAVAQERIPSIEMVSQKALVYARLDPSTISGWRKNLRKAPILPRLQFSYERRIRDYVNVDIQDTVAVNSTGITVGPPQQQQVQNLDNNNNFEVKAVWYLDQLLFSHEDIDISAEARELARERERILGQVRQFYFKRERLGHEMAALKKMGEAGIEWELKQLELAETTAALNNLTGGWFGATLGEEG